MDRYSDQTAAAEQPAGRARIRTCREMHAVECGLARDLRLAVQDQARARALRDRLQRPHQRDLLRLRQILLADADPPASCRAGLRDQVIEPPAGLPALGYEKQPPVGEARRRGEGRAAWGARPGPPCGAGARQDRWRPESRWRAKAPPRRDRAARGRRSPQAWPSRWRAPRAPAPP